MDAEVEVELLRKVRAGDPRFYEPLVRAYEGPGMRVALGMMGNREDAQDALQEAFIKVFRNLAKFDMKRAFGPWFYQILRNQCRDMLRSRQSRGRHEVKDERLEFRPASDRYDPVRMHERTAAKELLWEGLNLIGDEHREILVLKELQNFRYHEIAEILDKYAESGINNIMALRGDPPKGQKDFVQAEGGFRFAAELVDFIKRRHPQMGVGVAGFPEGHPTTPNRLEEIEFLKQKVDAGADYICTQLFFDNRDFYDFRERCELAGVQIPIIAGIMPLLSEKALIRTSELALGARIPAKLMKAFRRTEDDKQARQVGIHWATEQVRDLLENDVAGVHFYTLNRSSATKQIYRSLGIKDSTQLGS